MAVFFSEAVVGRSHVAGEDAEVELPSTSTPLDVYGLEDVAFPTPTRVHNSDDPIAILRFAAAEARNAGASLVTITSIDGGSSRKLGSQIAVASDGRFCGYISGGCLDSAVAFEALKAISNGRDSVMVFGNGSPYFDVILPCGGTIRLVAHVIRQPDELERVIEWVSQRTGAALVYDRFLGLEAVRNPLDTSACWSDDRFMALYRPSVRVVASGGGGELESFSRLVTAAGYDFMVCDGSSLDSAVIDNCTAVVSLHHDLDAEEQLLHRALAASPFYIGALGSSRTHVRRLERLANRGFVFGDQIRGPIGLFGPAKDFTSLSISILAEIAARRLVSDGVSVNIASDPVCGVSA